MELKNDHSFTTENLIFRPLKIDDKHHIYRLFSDPKVIQMDESEPMDSLQEAEQLIEYAIKSKFDPHTIYWGVELMERKGVIGTCGFKNWDRLSRRAEIGGNLASEFWGQGYAKEGLVAILNYAFDKMQLNKVCANTSCKNKKAIGIMNKFGFHQEGILREHQLLEGRYVDVYPFSLLKDEFSKRNY